MGDEFTTNRSQRSASQQTPTAAHASTSESFSQTEYNRESTSEPSGFSQAKCKEKFKSSRVLAKVSEKLFIENKKLKLKVTTLNSTVGILKKKNKQLENWKSKTNNKKLKFSQEIDELELLADSVRTKNKHTFNPEVLAKLDKLS